MTNFYIDSNFCCHREPGDGLREMESDFFDEREEIIESYKYVPFGESYTRYDGTVFEGEMIVPIISIPSQETSSAETDSERIAGLEAENAEYEAAIATLEEALNG